MTYGPQYVPEPPKKRLTRTQVALIIIGCLLVVCCSGAVVAAATGGGKASGDPIITSTTEPVFAGASSSVTPKKVPPPTAGTAELTKGGITLKVRTKNKTCYGSAGCNVEFSIDATVDGNVNITEPCDVTYEVKGLEDEFVSTLTIDDNDSYRQDSWQFGSTSSSKRKLTAQATEVRCG